MSITIQRGEQGKTNTWKASTCESCLRCEFPLSCWLNLSPSSTHPFSPIFFHYLFHSSLSLTFPTHHLYSSSYLNELVYGYNQTGDKGKNQPVPKKRDSTEQIGSHSKFEGESRDRPPYPANKRPKKARSSRQAPDRISPIFFHVAKGGTFTSLGDSKFHFKAGTGQNGNRAWSNET